MKPTPSVTVRIVDSTQLTGIVSSRVVAVNGKAALFRDLREALTDAGFRPGDIADIVLAGEDTVTS